MLNVKLGMFLLVSPVDLQCWLKVRHRDDYSRSGHDMIENIVKSGKSSVGVGMMILIVR